MQCVIVLDSTTISPNYFWSINRTSEYAVISACTTCTNGACYSSNKINTSMFDNITYERSTYPRFDFNFWFVLALFVNHETFLLALITSHDLYIDIVKQEDLIFSFFFNWLLIKDFSKYRIRENSIIFIISKTRFFPSLKSIMIDSDFSFDEKKTIL